MVQDRLANDSKVETRSTDLNSFHLGFADIMSDTQSNAKAASKHPNETKHATKDASIPADKIKHTIATKCGSEDPADQKTRDKNDAGQKTGCQSGIASGHAARGTYEGGRGGSGRGSASVTELDISPLKIAGFNQEATQVSEGLVGDVVRELKDTFFGAETIYERIKAKAIENLTPNQRAQYLSEQEGPHIRISGPFSKEFSFQINSPMHHLVDERIKMMEKQITEKVRSSMSPEELARVDKQFHKFEQEKKEANERNSNKEFAAVANMVPSMKIVTMLLKSNPEPGNALKNYFDLIKEESDRQLSK